MFETKKQEDLKAEDFLAHSTWASYYEPDEFELFRDLGLDLREAKSALERISFSDEYVFWLPDAANSMPFKYLYQAVHITTQGNQELLGYLTGSCLVVFHAEKQYLMNPAATNLALEAAKNLASALGEKVAFPLHIQVLATGTKETFSLP